MTKENLGIFIDSSSLLEMVNGTEGVGDDINVKLKEIKDSRIADRFIVNSTVAQLLRAVFLANPETKIQNLQKILSYIELVPSSNNVDYKSEESCRDEVLKIMKIVAQIKEAHRK